MDLKCMVSISEIRFRILDKGFSIVLFIEDRVLAYMPHDDNNVKPSLCHIRLIQLNLWVFFEERWETIKCVNVIL